LGGILRMLKNFISNLIAKDSFLKEEDIRAALLYAAKRIAHEEIYAT
jgi:uncharacterized protein (DUF433 family)